MSEPVKSRVGLFSKIKSAEDALKIIKDTSMGFFIVAGLQAALSFVLGFSVLFDAVIYVIGGFFLRRFNSRVAAVGLLVLAVAGASVTVANRAGANWGGGNNIILSLVVLWAAIRAVVATFKLHGRFSENKHTSLQ